MDLNLNNPSESVRFASGIRKLTYSVFFALGAIIGLSENPVHHGEIFLNLLFVGFLLWIGTFVYNWYCHDKMKQEL